MTHTIKLSDAELTIVLAALNVCTPTGGGSATRTLGARLSHIAGLNDIPEHNIETMATVFRHNVISDYAESCNELLGTLIQEQMQEWTQVEADV